MEIIVNKEDKSFLPIEEIEIGDGFIYNNYYFMKISTQSGDEIDNDNRCLAVCLKRYSSLHKFDPRTRVELVKNVKIIIEH
jgi:hypothetical protein